MAKCIYCGCETNLSKSDIIPDALTNARIINPNVCRVEHNNKFSDMFENDVIEKLAIITNQLNIKSSKSKNYARYHANIIIDGTEYSNRITSDASLFQNKIMRGADGKTLIGPYEEIMKIKNIDHMVKAEVDINELEIEKKAPIDMKVFFGAAMQRLVSKIAFEWYCLNNNVTDKIHAFEPLINFIVLGEGENSVSIVKDEKIYNYLNRITDIGSHTLISYVAIDGSVNILVSLFGIAIYNVKVCNSILQICPYNVLFLTVNISGKKDSFKYHSLSELQAELEHSFYQVSELQGLKIMKSNKDEDYMVAYKRMYLDFNFNRDDFLCRLEMNEKMISFLGSQINIIFNKSAVTIRGIKRFIKDNKDAIVNGVILNSHIKNTDAIFMFYLLYESGIESNDIHDFKDIEEFIRKKFGNEVDISDATCHSLLDEIISDGQYANIIYKGAENIEAMEI